MQMAKYNEECRCPLCGSNDTDWGEHEHDCDEIYYDVECNECGATWTDVYKCTFDGSCNIQDKAGKEYEPKEIKEGK